MSNINFILELTQNYLYLCVLKSHLNFANHLGRYHHTHTKFNKKNVNDTSGNTNNKKNRETNNGLS